VLGLGEKKDSPNHLHFVVNDFKIDFFILFIPELISIQIKLLYFCCCL